MQATIASGGRTKAPHELAMNRTVKNNTLGTTGVPRTGVGYSSVESSFTGRRVRSRDNQIPLADCSAYGLTPSGTLSREANQQLYADLSYAAYTYGQTSTSRALNWQMNQLAYSDGGSGAGYSYDRDPRPENWSRNEQTYAEYVHPTYGYEQASNYIFPQDLSQLAGQESLQPRNHSSSTYDGPALESEETLIHHFGNGYQHLFAFRESSVTEPSLYTSHDSAYYTEEDTKIERSLSPPSSQLFLPESSDFFLDYTDVGLETDASSMNCPYKTEEEVPENIGQVGLGIDYFTAEEVSTELLPVVPPPNSTRESKRLIDYFTADEVSTELLPVVPPPKSTRESKRLLDYLTAEEVSTELLPVVPPPKSTQRENKRLKIDTDLFTSLPQTNTSSPTEPTSATSATSATSTSSVNRNGKKFPCAYCTKVFNRPSSRSTHELVHTGEKPHMCTFPTCGKQFSVLSNLRRHLKIHRAPPKGRGRHANSSKKSNNSHDINNNISNSNIINQTSGDNINSINSIGNYIHGLGATSPHPYGGMGVREYFY